MTVISLIPAARGPKGSPIPARTLSRQPPMRRRLDSFTQGRSLRRALLESAATLAAMVALVGVLLAARLYFGLP